MEIDFSPTEELEFGLSGTASPDVDFGTGDVQGAIDLVKVNGQPLPVVNRTVDISVPTKTSQLTNDSHFITSSDIPTKTSQLTNDGSNGTDPFATVSQLPAPITVDSEIDNTSTNPVQNKALYDAIVGKEIVFSVPAISWSEPSGTNPYNTVAIVTLPAGSFTNNCMIELMIADKFNDFAKYGFVIYSAEAASQRIWLTAMKKPTSQVYLTIKVYTYGN